MDRSRWGPGLLLLFLGLLLGGLALFSVSPGLVGPNPTVSQVTGTPTPTEPAPPLPSPTCTAPPTVPAAPTAPPTPVPTTLPTRTATPAPAPTAALPDPVLPTVDRLTQTYTVRAGDTLSDLALRFGVTVLGLMQENHIPNISAIYTGQVLAIPRAAALTAGSAGSAKRIEVDLSEQRLFAFQGNQPVFEMIVSTGQEDSTLTGSFQILDKLASPYSDLWNFYMPDWMGIYYVDGDIENGIHALPMLGNGERLWGDALGTPVSYGCVVLAPDDARRLYDWAEIGTPVEIHW